jgi:hypothetical protein
MGNERIASVRHPSAWWLSRRSDFPDIHLFCQYLCHLSARRGRWIRRSDPQSATGEYASEIKNIYQPNYVNNQLTFHTSLGQEMRWPLVIDVNYSFWPGTLIVTHHARIRMRGKRWNTPSIREPSSPSAGVPDDTWISSSVSLWCYHLPNGSTWLEANPSSGQC